VSRWDTWLQQSIAASRSHLGEDWLDIYMTSPIWRFALFPGVCGERVWAGVLMPSVDKVGRYFPLTLTVALEARADTSMAIFMADAWYAALEDVALSVLRVDGSLDDLEVSLLQSPFPLTTASSDPGQPELSKLIAWWRLPGAEPLTLSLQHAGAVEKFMGMTMNGVFSTSGYGKSVWWSWKQDTDEGVLHCCEGLPPADHFATMLLGNLESS
jgi:type VI secretion system protein ImpM